MGGFFKRDMNTGEVVDAIILPDGSPFPHGASVWQRIHLLGRRHRRGHRAGVPYEDLIFTALGFGLRLLASGQGRGPELTLDVQFRLPRRRPAMIPRIFRCLTILMFAIAAAACCPGNERHDCRTGARRIGCQHARRQRDGHEPGHQCVVVADDEHARLLRGAVAPAGELSRDRRAAGIQDHGPHRRHTLSRPAGEMDLTLAVGAISESVTVTGDATILDTSVVTTGQNLDRRSVEGLPMFANMPVLLTRFVAGVNSSADVPYVAQGFVNRTSSDTSSPGGVGGNEWTIDGATNNGSDRRLAASPNADMIQEVRIETANFDASFGHSTGLGISMMTRSGTNLMHGSMNYRYWNNQWNAPRYFAKKNYYDNIAQASRAETTRWPTRWRRRRSTPSASPRISPTRSAVRLSRTSSSCSPTTRTTPTIVLRIRRKHSIPTEANLRGDFSNLLAVDPVRYQIYDPLTVRPDPARPGFFIRDPFPGNIIPANRIINPMYQHYIKFLPTPNNNPTNPRQEPANNYLVRTYTDPIQSQIFGARRITTTPIPNASSGGGAAATSSKGSMTGRIKAPRSIPRT